MMHYKSALVLAGFARKAQGVNILARNAGHSAGATSLAELHEQVPADVRASIDKSVAAPITKLQQEDGCDGTGRFQIDVWKLRKSKQCQIEKERLKECYENELQEIVKGVCEGCGESGNCTAKLPIVGKVDLRSGVKFLKMFDSLTKPFVLQFGTKKLLFKEEEGLSLEQEIADLRNEVSKKMNKGDIKCEVNAMRSIDLSAEAGYHSYQFELLQGSSSRALVEMIENIKPLSSVFKDLATDVKEFNELNHWPKKDKIQTWFQSNMKTDAQKDTLMASFAYEVVLNHCFGIQDRHNGNYLLNEETGRIIGIDFGFGLEKVYGPGIGKYEYALVLEEYLWNIIDAYGGNAAFEKIFKGIYTAVQTILKPDSDNDIWSLTTVRPKTRYFVRERVTKSADAIWDIVLKYRNSKTQWIFRENKYLPNHLCNYDDESCYQQKYEIYARIDSWNSTRPYVTDVVRRMGMTI